MAGVDQLYQAMEANDHATVRRLLERDAALVEATGETPPPIHWAIWQDRTEIVDLLLDHGADIERRDPDRHATPLAYAIVYGRKEIIRLLVARGGDLKNEDQTDNMLELALRGAAGFFDDYDDVATSREAFGEIAGLLRELGATTTRAISG
jgi:ankyrin repeat protein